MPDRGITWVIRTLESESGSVPLKPVLDPIDELVQTVLSQNTSDINSGRAYENLVSRFTTWKEVLEAIDQEIADAIRPGGLADIKAPRIKAILADVLRRRGRLDLFFLRDLPLHDAQDWLEELPGVGPKTAACVLLFSLGMPALPVDTHVMRVSHRLGLVPARANASKTQELLQNMVRPKDVYSFHLLLIRHGRTVCRARGPLCGECVLCSRCPSALT
ncbi:MAG: endonuclease III [Dehalococcoidia bacterium]|nr:endonuclease III [Dehalococcoidia bacterium]